jgi:hypothetical protein
MMRKKKENLNPGLKAFQRDIKNTDNLGEKLGILLQEKVSFNNFQKMILLAEAIKEKDPLPSGSSLQTLFKQKMRELEEKEIDGPREHPLEKEKRKAFQVIYNNITTVLFGKPSKEEEKAFALYKDRILHNQKLEPLLNDYFIKRQAILIDNPYADSFQKELEQLNPNLPLPSKLEKLMRQAQNIIKQPKRVSEQDIKVWQKEADGWLKTCIKKYPNTGPDKKKLIQEAQRAISAVLDKKEEFEEYKKELKTALKAGQIPKDLFIEGQKSLSVHDLLSNIPDADAVDFLKALITELPPQTLQTLFQEKMYRNFFSAFLAEALNQSMADILETKVHNNKVVHYVKEEANDNVVINSLITFNALKQTINDATLRPIRKKVKDVLQSYFRQRYTWIYLNEIESINNDIDRFIVAKKNSAFVDSLVNKGSVEKCLEKYQPKKASDWVPWKTTLIEKFLNPINSPVSELDSHYRIFPCFKTIVLLAQAIKEHAPKLMEDSTIQTHFRQAISHFKKEVGKIKASDNDKRIFHALCNSIDIFLFEKPSALECKHFALYRNCIKNSPSFQSLLASLNKEPIKQSLVLGDTYTDLGSFQKEVNPLELQQPRFKQVAYALIKELKVLQDKRTCHGDIREANIVLNEGALYLSTLAEPKVGEDGVPIITSGYSLNAQKVKADNYDGSSGIPVVGSNFDQANLS